MLRGDLQNKLLEVKIGGHVSIDRFADDVGPLQAILLCPFTVELILGLLRFLLIGSVLFFLLARTTYVCSRSQLSRLHSIVVETVPLFECFPSTLLIVVIFPMEHLWAIVQTDCLAICFDDLGRVVKKIVCVNDTNVGWRGRISSSTVRAVCCPVRFMGSTVHAIGGLRSPVLSCASERRSHTTSGDQVIEDSADLIVPGFILEEFIEPCDLVEGRDCASIVRRDAEMRITDQKREEELLQHFARDDGWIAWLRWRAVWEWP